MDALWLVVDIAAVTPATVLGHKAKGEAVMMEQWLSNVSEFENSSLSQVLLSGSGSILGFVESGVGVMGS